MKCSHSVDNTSKATIETAALPVPTCRKYIRPILQEQDEVIVPVDLTCLFSMDFNLEVSKILPIFVYRNQEKQGDKSGHRQIPKRSRRSRSYMRNDTQIQGRG